MKKIAALNHRCFNKISGITFLFLLFLLPVIICFCEGYKTDRSRKNMVRLSLITVDPEQLDCYNEFLKEEIETSLRLEPGVLALYAISEKEHPHKIKILEIYADEPAYLSHIQTPHFLKYKEGTINMVQELELIDMVPLLPGFIINSNKWEIIY